MVNINTLINSLLNYGFLILLILSAEDIQEQESEYTEHYDIATQRHLDSLTKSESSDFSPPIDSTMGNEER